MLRKKRFRPNQVIRDNPKMMKTRLFPGRMYMFMYDPKTKETLPYYDRFPLIIPFRIETNDFYGINFHYLPYYMRIKILDRLMAFRTNQNMDEQTRFKMSYNLIKDSARFRPVKPCVKHYLKGNVKSLFKEVPSYDWATAMMLPVEQFRGAPMNAVHQESRKIGRF